MGASRSAHPALRSSRRRLGLFAAVAMLVAMLVTGTPSPADAHTVNRSKVVLFIHGYNPTSNSTDCGATFDRMIGQLRAEGFTGSLVKVGFYSGDVNCDVNLRSYGSFTDSSSWKGISKAFSTYVYNTYTSRGIPVDVVGYSMGGLISRGGVYGSQKREAGFAPPIDVEDSVTLGTPHTGAAWYTNFCLWGQCASMKPGSTDLKWLNQNGNPQGRYGTDWTNIGSNGDAVTPTASATSMSIPSSAKVVYASIPHTGSGNYMGNPTSTTRTGVGLAELLK
ncbi:esterase/lipase family protein [Aquihabitans daechungensis]|uniref:esterase/lipase family protein n=1 Tax=Aquihabitans daechungensis TaxID=1052257 RepID=UPI003B9FBF9B